jgi:hypothetical protein
MVHLSTTFLKADAGGDAGSFRNLTCFKRRSVQMMLVAAVVSSVGIYSPLVYLVSEEINLYGWGIGLGKRLDTTSVHAEKKVSGISVLSTVMPLTFVFHLQHSVLQMKHSRSHTKSENHNLLTVQAVYRDRPCKRRKERYQQ